MPKTQRVKIAMAQIFCLDGDRLGNLLRIENAAKKIGCPVIGTDLIGQISHGPWTGQIYGGQSVAVNQKGDILIIGKDRERDIIVFNVDLKN